MKAIITTMILAGVVCMTGCNSENTEKPDPKKAADTGSQQALYDCSICKLHFEDEQTAKECEEWCRNNDSCNLAIASKSIEARKSKE